MFAAIVHLNRSGFHLHRFKASTRAPIASPCLLCVQELLLLLPVMQRSVILSERRISSSSSAVATTPGVVSYNCLLYFSVQYTKFNFKFLINFILNNILIAFVLIIIYIFCIKTLINKTSWTASCLLHLLLSQQINNYEHNFKVVTVETSDNSKWFVIHFFPLTQTLTCSLSFQTIKIITIKNDDMYMLK